MRGAKLVLDSDFDPEEDDNSYDEATDSYELDPYNISACGKLTSGEVCKITKAVAQLLFPDANPDKIEKFDLPNQNDAETTAWLWFYSHQPVDVVRDAWIKVLAEHDAEKTNT